MTSSDRASALTYRSSTDAALRTRLNARRAWEQLERELKTQRLLGVVPQSVTLTLNGKTYLALRVEEDPGLTRGTGATQQYQGTVIFYMADGEGMQRLAFADEEHCANWSRTGGWTEDARAW